MTADICQRNASRNSPQITRAPHISNLVARRRTILQLRNPTPRNRDIRSTSPFIQRQYDMFKASRAQWSRPNLSRAFY